MKLTKKVKRFICKIFGHKFSAIEVCLFGIEVDAVSLGSKIHPILTCQRCGAVFKGIQPMKTKKKTKLPGISKAKEQ